MRKTLAKARQKLLRYSSFLIDKIKRVSLLDTPLHFLTHKDQEVLKLSHQFDCCHITVSWNHGCWGEIDHLRKCRDPLRHMSILIEENRKQGIATRALSAFHKHIKMRPLYGRAAKDNSASLRVLEKCGFTRIDEGQGFFNARGEEVEEFILRLDHLNG